MKIAIDLTPLYGRKWTGVELYAIDLYRALVKIGFDVIPIFHVENSLDKNKNAFIIKKCNRLILENLKLAKAIALIKADVTLFPIFPPPINCYGGVSKIVPVIHDLTFIKFSETQNRAAKWYYTPKTKLALNKSDAIITISETVRKELLEVTSIPVYNCGEDISHDFFDCKGLADNKYLKKWKLSPQKYMISVSTIEPRKNFKYLLQVIRPFLKKNNMKLVLVGRKGWGKDKELEILIKEMGDLLIFTEYVSHECLVSLYHYAYAFALLSIYEGFGRTPFEAVACGCKKIILSDIPIFKETFGDAAYYIPLNDVDGCKILLENISMIPEIEDDFSLPFNVLEQRLPSVLASINKKLESICTINEKT